MHIYHTIRRPALPLRRFVKEYMLLDFIAGDEESVPVKPFPATNEQCLVFYLRGSVRAVDAAAGRAETFARIALNGTQTTRLDFHISRSFRLLSIAFHPGMLALFLRQPLPEFTDQRLDAELVLGVDVSRIYEQLIHAPAYDDIFSITDHYLFHRIGSIEDNLSPLDKVLASMHYHRADYPIEKMASDACLSLSQFERRFVQTMGITPKLFLRINRFDHAYRLKENNSDYDWLRVALEAGYYDYQHLVKDFRQFSASTPRTLLAAQAQAPENLFIAARQQADFLPPAGD